MTRFLPIALLFFHNNSFGQDQDTVDCKIEFYLLKTLKPNLDTTKSSPGAFLATNTDLADTAFIKDFEIISYLISTDTIKKSDNPNIIKERHRFKVNSIATQRINNLNIPPCCGIQFALVVNGHIAYTGYFWNLHSSFGAEWITAFSYETYIDIMRRLPDYNFPNQANDIRRNPILFDCLNKTGRLTNSK